MDEKQVLKICDFGGTVSIIPFRFRVIQTIFVFCGVDPHSHPHPFALLMLLMPMSIDVLCSCD